MGFSHGTVFGVGESLPSLASSRRCWSFPLMRPILSLPVVFPRRDIHILSPCPGFAASGRYTRQRTSRICKRRHCLAPTQTSVELKNSHLGCHQGKIHDAHYNTEEHIRTDFMIFGQFFSPPSEKIHREDKFDNAYSHNISV